MKKSKTFFACAMLAALASCSNDHVLSQQSPTPSDPDVINIVAAKDTIGNSFFTSFVRGGHSCCIHTNLFSVQKVNTLVNKFYHNSKLEN